MRLPYFYQQMLGYLAVIITLMYISIFSFYHFTRNMILDNTETTLNNYAESLIININNEQDFTQEQRILENQNYHFIISNSQNEIVFPESHTNTNIEEYLEEDTFQRLENGETVTTSLQVNSGQNESSDEMREIVVTYAPYTSSETGDYGGFVGVSTPISLINEQINNLEEQLFKAFLISSILALLISILISRHQVNRINRLREAAKKVSEGDYNVRIEHNSRDELDSLARDFNKMILELEEASKEVDKQEQRRKTFMQDAAHEMRTPLTTINGLLEGLEHGVIDEKNQTRSIQLMNKETKRLIRLVNENLDYENIRSNRIKLVKNHIPLHEIFDEIAYQMNKLAENSANQLIMENDSDLTVWADFDRLKQILVNLIKNAIQFTDEGTIWVYAEKTSFGTQIFIKDTGVGMSVDQTNNIWERYYKADESRMNTRYGESGLGLSIVHQLVHMHGARLDVETELGQGTTFSVEFPDSKEQEKELNQQRQEDIIE